MKMSTGVSAFIITIAAAIISSGLAFLSYKSQIKAKEKNPYWPNELVIIDSCEYIKIDGGIFKVTQYIHKENCKNPFHAK